MEWMCMVKSENMWNSFKEMKFPTISFAVGFSIFGKIAMCWKIVWRMQRLPNDVFKVDVMYGFYSSNLSLCARVDILRWVFFFWQGLVGKTKKQHKKTTWTEWVSAHKNMNDLKKNKPIKTWDRHFFLFRIIAALYFVIFPVALLVFVNASHQMCPLCTIVSERNKWKPIHFYR